MNTVTIESVYVWKKESSDQDEPPSISIAAGGFNRRASSDFVSLLSERAYCQ